MKMVLVLFSLMFFYSCQQASTADEENLDADATVAKDAAAMEENTADCDDDSDKIMDAAASESDDVFSAKTGCSVDE